MSKQPWSTPWQERDTAQARIYRILMEHRGYWVPYEVLIREGLKHPVIPPTYQDSVRDVHAVISFLRIRLNGEVQIDCASTVGYRIRDAGTTVPVDMMTAAYEQMDQERLKARIEKSLSAAGVE